MTPNKSAPQADTVSERPIMNRRQRRAAAARDRKELKQLRKKLDKDAFDRFHAIEQEVARARGVR